MQRDRHRQIRRNYILHLEHSPDSAPKPNVDVSPQCNSSSQQHTPPRLYLDKSESSGAYFQHSFQRAFPKDLSSALLARFYTLILHPSRFTLFCARRTRSLCFGCRFPIESEMPPYLCWLVDWVLGERARRHLIFAAVAGMRAAPRRGAGRASR
jgi:hypothetical protein